MGDNSIGVSFHVLGYNKKGLVGFVTGGTKLTYMEITDANKNCIEEMHLPYILDIYVQSTNKELKRRKKDAERKE